MGETARATLFGEYIGGRSYEESRAVLRTQSSVVPPSDREVDQQHWHVTNVVVLRPGTAQLSTGLFRDGCAATHWFILVESGAGSHQIDFVDHRAGAGSVLHVRPGQYQVWHRKNSFHATIITVEVEAGAEPKAPLLGGWFQQSNPVTELGESESVVAALAEEITREWSSPDIDREIVSASAALLIRHVVRSVAAPSNDDVTHTRLLRSFFTEVDQRFRQSRSVADYAKRLDISPKTLNRAATKLLGRSPKTLIDERVVLEAKRQLAGTTDSAAAIGVSLGFGEPTNFHKFFARHTNLSPQEFRISQLVSIH